jgi:hypothetical protein
MRTEKFRLNYDHSLRSIKRASNTIHPIVFFCLFFWSLLTDCQSNSILTAIFFQCGNILYIYSIIVTMLFHIQKNDAFITIGQRTPWYMMNVSFAQWQCFLFLLPSDLASLSCYCTNLLYSD